MSSSHIKIVRLAAVLEDHSVQLDLLGHSLAVQRTRAGGGGAAQEKDRLTKLTSDCQYTSQDMSKLRLELEEKKNSGFLQQMLEEEEQQKKAEDMMRGLQQRRCRQIEERRRKYETFQEMCRQASALSGELFAAKKRDEEELQKIQSEAGESEELLEEQQERLQVQLEQERRVHEESKEFLQNRHEELQQKLQLWQQRTKQTKKETEQQLNNVCCKGRLNLDRLMEMRRKFREMEQVVMEDRVEQEQLCRQQLEARAATMLQAWWRGHMVRHGLWRSEKAEGDKKGKEKRDGKKKKKKK